MTPLEFHNVAVNKPIGAAWVARLLLVLLALLLPGCATTSTRARLSDQLNYTTNKNAVVITKYTGSGDAVIIPSRITGRPVTSISNSAFQSCIRLTSVVIPNSVTNVGAWAFQGIAHLTNVTIGSSVTRIGDSAFFNCTSLTGIAIPNSVKSIGELAFNGCPLNSHITIPGSVTNIGKAAFAGCRNLTNITIPKHVISIGDRAFGSCINLTAITVDPLNPVYSSRDGILFNKNQTTLIQCPAGKSGNVTIPNGVINIGDQAFKICRLTSVIIPNSVTRIGNEAFISCDHLTNITIPNSVASIGDDGFAFCHRLTGIYFQGNAPKLGKDVFNDRCGDVVVDHDPVTVYYLPGTTGWASTFGGRPTVVLLTPSEWTYAIETNDNTISITKYAGSGGVVTVPDKIYGRPVTSIRNETFDSSANLTSITIPKSVTNIGVHVFERCTNLTSIHFQGNASSRSDNISGGNNKATVYYLPTSPERSYAFEAINNEIAITKYTGYGSEVVIPDKIKGLPVTSIGARAFAHCSSLAGVTIPDSVTSIGDGAFSECTGLTNITIPASVTNIGDLAFSSCTSLGTITVDQRNSFYSGLDGVLFDKRQTTLIRYPMSKTGSYTIPDGITTIEHKAFDNCANLTGVTIPNSVKTIQSGAFIGCYNLTDITIPENVTSIGDFAFTATSLTSITIPASATNIEKGAFEGCASLTEITVDTLNPIYSGRDGVLFNKNQTTLIQCPGGKAGNYSISNSVTTIGEMAFRECHKLTSITIPNSISGIGFAAFISCSRLTEIYFQGDITKLVDGVFADCHNLTSIYFKGNAPSLGNHVFDGNKKATVYYLPGTTGWGETLGGRPTAVWTGKSPQQLPPLSPPR